VPTPDPTAEARYEPLTPRQKMVRLAFLRFLARRELFRRRLRRDPQLFIEYVIETETGEPLKLAWFHREWLDLLSEHLDCIIIAPRGHGKCMVAGTPVQMADGRRLPVEEITEPDEVLAWDDGGLKFKPAACSAVFDSGVQECVELETGAGRRLTVTTDHPVWTRAEWVYAGRLCPGNPVCVLEDDGRHGWDELVSVTPVGLRQTFGIEVPGLHSHVTGGIVTHNTTILVGRVLWELGNNQNLRIKIVCQSDDKAKERLYEVQRHIEENPRLKFVFPNLLPAGKGEWSKHKMYVRRTIVARDASVHALGILSTATGGRSDLNICDDVVDRRNAILQPKQRENVKMSFKGDFSNLLLPGGRTWYIATKWHKDDLTHDLLRNKDRIYAIREYAINENLDPIWEAMWPRAALSRQRKKIGKVEFDRGFRNIALSGDVIVIQPHWIKYRPLRQFPDDLHLVVAYDLAISGKKSSDYFAWCVEGWSPSEKKMFVLSAGHAKLSFFQQFKRVVADWLKWRARRIIIETIGYQAALAQELDRVTMLPVYGFKPSADKGTRLLEVSPYIETGNVIFADHLDPERDQATQERGDLVSELTEFPLYVTDDVMDAFVEGLICLIDVYSQGLLADMMSEYSEEDGMWLDWEDDDGADVGVTVAGGGDW